MPGSMASLDSLSSPSPSPSPEPQRALSNQVAGAGLDSGSELSELTEEEENHNERDDIEEEDDEDEDDGQDKRKRSLRRGGRKKGRGIVPAPMWDWAKPRASTVVEEEEEEELIGPPRAMEEEEEDEDEDGSRPATSAHKAPINEEDEEDVPPGLALANPVKKPVLRGDSGSDGEWSKHKGHPRKGFDYGSDEELTDTSPPPPTRPSAPGEDSGAETESEEDERAELDVVDADMDAGVPMAPTEPPVASPRMDVDMTAPSPDVVAPLAAAAAASSIMAGSSVLKSPTPSASSSVSGTPASSRSPSPAPVLPSKKLIDTQSTKHLEKGKDMPPPPVPDITSISVSHLDADTETVDQDHEESIEDAPVDQDDIELESDLQPAHRAEALDVLATIELKFALLRERVYVEKMEGLAWEEALIGEGTHPELIHLHAELSKRRDKRLDLATRKRAYETANVTKRRKIDEDAVWSWWQFARDELQTDMISETNRKRRKLERDRRALERPQPVRRIPIPPQDVSAAPSLRQIIKSSPISRRSHNSSSPRLLSLVYPELSTLTSADISLDLDFLYSHRRPTFEAHHRANGPPLNGSLGPVGPPHGFDIYSVNGSMNIDGPPQFIGPGTRMPPPPPPFQHQNPHSQMQGQPLAPGFPPLMPGPSRSLHQLHPLHHQSPFSAEQEPLVLSGPAGHGHPSQHPYGGPGPGISGPSNSSYQNHGPPETRRSISPVHVIPRTNGGTNGSRNKWVGEGIMSGFSSRAPEEWIGDTRRNDVGPGGDRDNETLFRMKEREGPAKRDRPFDRDKNREREKDRDREQQDFERDQDQERSHHMQHILQPQQLPPPQPQGPPSHRHTPHQHQHILTAPGQPQHHQLGPHHHHHHHHHHVHHHHAQPSTSVGPGNGHSISSGPALPITSPLNAGPTVSPRASGPAAREFDLGRPHTGPLHPTEVINLTSSKSSPSIWKLDEPRMSPPEYREFRGKQASRPSSGPPVGPGGHEERERPLAMPFVMSSTHSMPASLTSNLAHSGMANGQAHSGGSSIAPSPRAAWNVDENPYRLPPSASLAGSLEPHRTSPGPHRYQRNTQPTPLSRQSSLGLSSPRNRPRLPHSPPSAGQFPGPMRSPTRYAPPLASGAPPHTSVHQSTSAHGHVSNSPILKAHRAGSPKMGPTNSSSVFSPSLSGPGRTSTPTATVGNPIDIHGGILGPGTAPSVPSYNPMSSRTASPLTTYPSPRSHPSLPPPRMPPNAGAAPDKQSPRISSMLPPPKMNVAQMVDGP